MCLKKTYTYRITVFFILLLLAACTTAPPTHVSTPSPSVNQAPILQKPQAVSPVQSFHIQSSNKIPSCAQINDINQTVSNMKFRIYRVHRLYGASWTDYMGFNKSTITFSRDSANNIILSEVSFWLIEGDFVNVYTLGAIPVYTGTKSFNEPFTLDLDDSKVGFQYSNNAGGRETYTGGHMTLVYDPQGKTIEVGISGTSNLVNSTSIYLASGQVELQGDATFGFTLAPDKETADLSTTVTEIKPGESASFLVTKPACGDWKLTVKDPNGNVCQTATGSDAVKDWTWDGTCNGGPAAPGDYTVTLESSNGDTFPPLKLTVKPSPSPTPTPPPTPPPTPTPPINCPLCPPLLHHLHRRDRHQRLHR